MSQVPFTIQPLTPEALYSLAREKAEQHVPLSEANHFEPGSVQWHDFNVAYSQAAFTSGSEVM